MHLKRSSIFKFNQCFCLTRLFLTILYYNIVGFNIKTLEYNGFMLNIWDVGGQKSIRPFWRNYFEQTDGIIWVVDSVDKFRLEECKIQLREILGQEKLAGFDDF